MLQTQAVASWTLVLIQHQMVGGTAQAHVLDHRRSFAINLRFPAFFK